MAESKILRHITPFWVLGIIDRVFNLCWHKMVLWKMGYDINNWQVEDRCFMGSPDGWDYCGKHGAKGEKWLKEYVS